VIEVLVKACDRMVVGFFFKCFPKGLFGSSRTKDHHWVEFSSLTLS